MSVENGKANFFSRILGWLFISPLAFGYFLLKGGVDVSDYYFFKVINSFFYELMPMLKLFEASKNFDGSVSGFYLLLYVWSPVAFVCFFWGNIWQRKRVLEMAKSSEGRKFIPVIVVMTILLVLATQFLGVDPASCRRHCANTSMFGFLMVLGSVWVTLTLFLSFIVVLIYTFLRKE
ncbi:hypothetical protein [Hahella chejuensis]|uniref:hypothetical protein n=1 Tax=Hahella chejuensis TaxID=158327 RepID=UPI0011D0B62A|nr:hypothetical protein [Hahella chejuensis]